MEKNLFSSRSLASLTSWSIEHIRDIFEARSDEESLRAIEKTFSKDVEATVNGKPIGFNDIQRMVLGLRTGSRLKVSWQQARETPFDTSTNRNGAFSGAYVVHGIQRSLPGSNYPVEFERHKSVQVQIESQSPDISVDSRRIVKLAFAATDVRVHRQASL